MKMLDIISSGGGDGERNSPACNRHRKDCTPIQESNHSQAMGIFKPHKKLVQQRLTVEVLFENAFPASDPGTLEQLKELSSRRRAIESINQNSFVTDAVAREMSGGLTSRCEQNIQKVETYLPLLGHFIHHVNIVCENPKMVRWISDLKIRWSSAFTSSSFFHLNGPKLYQINNLHLELSMILSVLGGLLRNRALEVLSKGIFSTICLHSQKAAGVYQHLALDVLPCLQPALAPERPPEAVIGVSAATALVCLAEAQAVSVRKAEQKGNTGGLLAKLHYGVCEFLNEAIHTLHSATKQCKDISSFNGGWGCFTLIRGQGYNPCYGENSVGSAATLMGPATPNSN
ncbi:hypothetical protein P3S67_029437 [Capsicum chacoense]